MAIAKAFKLIAKRDIRSKQGKVILAKGMSFEHIEVANSSPQSNNVHKTIQERYGVEVGLNAICNDFEVIKL